MKKIATFFSLLMVGATFAGSLDWGAVNVQPSSGEYSTRETYSAYFYIITGNVTYDAVIGYLDGGNRSAAINASSDSMTAEALTSTMLNFTAKNLEATSGSSISAFMVIADAASINDANNYLVALLSGTGDAVLQRTIPSTAGAADFTYGNQASNTAWNEIGAVPEPASMSLLLVGLAGIGLRRKLKKAKKAA